MVFTATFYFPPMISITIPGINHFLKRTLLLFVWIIASSHTLILYAQIGELSKAQDLFNNNQYEEALPLLEKLYGNFPADPFISFCYGACIIEVLQDPDLGLTILERIPAHQFNPLHYFYLGKAYLIDYRAKNAKEAFSYFMQRAGKKEIRKTRADYGYASAINLDLIPNIYPIYSAELIGTWHLHSLKQNLLVFLEQEGENFESLPINSLSQLNLELYYDSQAIARVEIGKNNQNLFFFRKSDQDKPQKELVFTTNNPEQILNPIVISTNEIVFAWNGKYGLGGFDLFRSQFDSLQNSWSEPVNLGFPINSPCDEILLLPQKKIDRYLLISNRHQPKSLFNLYQLESSNTTDSIFQVDKLKELADFANYETIFQNKPTDSLSFEDFADFRTKIRILQIQHQPKELHRFFVLSKNLLEEREQELLQLRISHLRQYLQQKKEHRQIQKKFDQYKSTSQRDSLLLLELEYKNMMKEKKEQSNFVGEYLELIRFRKGILDTTIIRLERLDQNLPGFNDEIKILLSYIHDETKYVFHLKEDMEWHNEELQMIELEIEKIQDELSRLNRGDYIFKEHLNRKLLSAQAIERQHIHTISKLLELELELANNKNQLIEKTYFNQELDELEKEFNQEFDSLKREKSIPIKFREKH